MSDCIDTARISDIQEGTMKKSRSWAGVSFLRWSKDDITRLTQSVRISKVTFHQGPLEGTTLTCPMHKSQFDLRDGHVLR
ncbi:MAG: Rieske 2Fe-2S domain-containing protein [Methanoregula sp.]|nr:Rieske 2Fe-2S domain-containing protein [Methanoregula sp.]